MKGKYDIPVFALRDLDEHPITLRDYFAAAYMQGYMANPDARFPTRERVGEEAYMMADAMLKARES
jgi:hypothetical protein